MSMKRLAILAAVQTAQYAHNGTVQTSSSSSSSGGSTYVIQGYNTSINGNAGPPNLSLGIGGGNIAGGTTGRYETDLHGNVNILLGGAMLSGVIIVVVLVCYCCHRNIRKHQPQEYSQYWRAEPDVHSLEVFTMDSHAMQCYERSGMMGLEESILASVPRPVTPGPPPAYESLLFNTESVGIGMGMGVGEKKETPTSPGGESLPLPVLDGGLGLAKEEESRKEDEGLPSYEAALKLEASGYV